MQTVLSPWGYIRWAFFRFIVICVLLLICIRHMHLELLAFKPYRLLAFQIQTAIHTSQSWQLSASRHTVSSMTEEVTDLGRDEDWMLS